MTTNVHRLALTGRMLSFRAIASSAKEAAAWQREPETDYS